MVVKKHVFVFVGLSILIISSVFIVFNNETKAEAEACFGKCTGRANCTACSTCNYCKYCNSGGSCGVCSNSSGSYTKPNYNTQKKYENPTFSNKTSDVYFVNSKSLNLRTLPSTSAQILYTLPYGFEVYYLSYYDQNWVRIQVVGVDESGTPINVSGYVYQKYISKK